MTWNTNPIFSGKTLSYEEITNDYELTYLIENSDFSFMQAQINKNDDYHIGGSFDITWFRFFLTTNSEITLGLLGICPLMNIHPEECDEDDDTESVMYIACVEVSKQAKKELGIIKSQKGVLSNIVNFIHYKYPECYEIRLSTESDSPKLRAAYEQCGFKVYGKTSWGGYKMMKPVSLYESFGNNIKKVNKETIQNIAEDSLDLIKYSIITLIKEKNESGDSLTKEPNMDTYCGIDFPETPLSISEHIKNFLDYGNFCKIQSAYIYYYQNTFDYEHKICCWDYLKEKDDDLLLWIDFANEDCTDFESVEWEDLTDELKKDVSKLVSKMQMNESVGANIKKSSKSNLQTDADNSMLSSDDMKKILINKIQKDENTGIVYSEYDDEIQNLEMPENCHFSDAITIVDPYFNTLKSHYYIKAIQYDYKKRLIICLSKGKDADYGKTGFNEYIWEHIPNNIQNEIFHLVMNTNESVKANIKKAGKFDFDQKANKNATSATFDDVVEELNLPFVNKHFYNNGDDASWIMVSSKQKDVTGYWHFVIQVRGRNGKCFIECVKFSMPIYSFGKDRMDDNEWLEKHYSNDGFNSLSGMNEIILHFNGYDAGTELSYNGLLRLKKILDIVNTIPEIQKTTNDNNPIEAIYQSGLGDYFTKNSKSDWNFTVGTAKWGGYTDWEMSYPANKRDEMHFPLNESVGANLKKGKTQDLTQQADDSITLESQFQELVNNTMDSKGYFNINIDWDNRIPFDWKGRLLELGGCSCFPDDKARGIIRCSLWWKADNGQSQYAYKPSILRGLGFPTCLAEIPEDTKQLFYRKVLEGAYKINESVGANIRKSQIQDLNNQANDSITGVFTDNGEFANTLADEFEKTPIRNRILKKLESFGLDESYQFIYSKNDNQLKNCIESIADSEELEYATDPDLEHSIGITVHVQNCGEYKTLFYILLIPDNTKPICEIAVYTDTTSWSYEENPYVIGKILPKSLVGIRKMLLAIPQIIKIFRAEKFNQRINNAIKALNKKDMEDCDREQGYRMEPTEIFSDVITSHSDELFGNINESININIKGSKVKDIKPLDFSVKRTIIDYLKSLPEDKLSLCYGDTRFLTISKKTSHNLLMALKDRIKIYICNNFNAVKIVGDEIGKDENDYLELAEVATDKKGQHFTSEGKLVNDEDDKLHLQFNYHSNKFFNLYPDDTFSGFQSIPLRWEDLPSAYQPEIYNLIMSTNESMNTNLNRSTSKDLTDEANDKALIPDKTMKLSLDEVIDFNDTSLKTFFLDNWYEFASDGTYEKDEFPCYVYHDICLKYDEDGEPIEDRGEYDEFRGFEQDLIFGAWFDSSEHMAKGTDFYSDGKFIIEDERHNKTWKGDDFYRILYQALHYYYKYTPIEIKNSEYGY